MSDGDLTKKLEKELSHTKKKMQALEKDLKKKEKKYSKTIKAKAQEGMELFEHEEKEVEKYIKENPMKAVGVAFAVGFLLGKLSK